MRPMTPDCGVDRVDEAIHAANAYIETGNYQRARDVLRHSLSQHPNDPALLRHYARAEYSLDNYTSAAWSAYAVLSAVPHDEWATRIYALSLAGLGRLHEALWMSWRAVMAHPNEPLQHEVYARLLRKSRQLPSALVVVDKSLRLDPVSVDALVLRGLILEELGRIDESDASYRQALSLHPGHAWALNNLAVNRLRGGKFGLALKGFLGAGGVDPRIGDLARSNIGVVLAKILKRVTMVAVVLGAYAVEVSATHCSGHSTVITRALTGLVTAALIVVLGWMLRSVPRRVLISVLRDRGFVAARLIHALLAVGLGTVITVFGGAVWTIPAGVVVTVAGLILVRVGLTTGFS